MKDNDMPKNPYSTQPRRHAEKFMPINTLKNKVGSGGLSEEILSKAQAMLEDNNVDFIPLADLYLNSLNFAMEVAQSRMERDDADHEGLIYGMLYPVMQLKANGGMFKFSLVTDISNRLIHFLEVIEKVDMDAIEIVAGFQTTIRAITAGRVTGDGGAHGKTLARALDQACHRYFERHPDNRIDRLDYSDNF